MLLSSSVWADKMVRWCVTQVSLRPTDRPNETGAIGEINRRRNDKTQLKAAPFNEVKFFIMLLFLLSAATAALPMAAAKRHIPSPAHPPDPAASSNKNQFNLGYRRCNKRLIGWPEWTKTCTKLHIIWKVNHSIFASSRPNLFWLNFHRNPFKFDVIFDTIEVAK